MTSVPTLGYWNIRGRAQPIRYLLTYAGVEFNDKRYVLKDWQSDKHNLGFDFPNLPYYMDGDIKLTQSLAIMKYLARKHGLVARDDPTLARQELIEQFVYDIQHGFLPIIMSDDYAAKRDQYSTGTLTPQLHLLAEFLGDKEWLTGQLSYVDFIVYEVLDWLRLFTPDTFRQFPTLDQYLDRFEALPEINDYMNGKEFKTRPLFAPYIKWMPK